MKEWAERDEQSNYVVIPGAGHSANRDNSEFFNKVMMEFLEGLGIQDIESHPPLGGFFP
jgi:pimeloyl-ACP methyl ester carboxylesterase